MKLLLLAVFSFFLLPSLQAQVAVSADGIAPHPSAMLDVRSTTKGVLLPRMSYAERTAIAAPAQGLMVYQTNHSTTPRGFYIFDGTVWKELANAEDLGGGSSWTLSGNRLYANHGGNVGIGTTNPTHKLQVTDGSFALHNSTAAKYWYLLNSSPNSGLLFIEDGAVRMFLANGGNIGIGNAAPTAKLHVTGSGRFTDNLTVDDNMSVDNTLAVGDNITVGNRGVLYNAASSAKLRYYTREAAFTVVNLAPHGISPEGSIGFSGFTNPPVVLVGNIVTTGGTTGQLYKCQLVIYDVTAAGCKARISNTSNTTINQDITWNIVCIGN
jgi:hypothetical protein